MKITNVIQKLFPSIINVLVVGVFSLPLLFASISILDKKLIVVGIFFIYTLTFLVFNGNRDFGMMIGKTYWKEKYSLWRHLIYNIFYTASFATILFSIRFPFDLFIINMALLQLPTILLTGTTVHGFISGRLTTVIK
jgi:hypothetical protein